MTLSILHVLATSQRRGAETFGLELHRRLAGNGHRSDVVALEPGPDGAGLPVPALATTRFSLSGLRALRARAANTSAVVAHGSSTLLACGAGLAGTSVPFVYLSIGDPRFWAPSGLRRTRVRILLRRAAEVVAICAPARDILIDHFGLPPARVHVIPNGRSGTRFAPAEPADVESARRALGLPGGVRVVVAVGALTPEKRVDVAVRAVAALPDVVLVVAGDGAERPRLERLAALDAPGRVVFLGSIDHPEEVFAAADALVLSSDSEGVPGVLIEAGLSGLPIAATDVGWVDEVVVDGRTGRLCPAGDPARLAAALAEVLRESHRMGAAARSHCVERFEIDRVVSTWEELLATVAREP